MMIKYKPVNRSVPFYIARIKEMSGIIEKWLVTTQTHAHDARSQEPKGLCSVYDKWSTPSSNTVSPSNFIYIIRGVGGGKRKAEKYVNSVLCWDITQRIQAMSGNPLPLYAAKYPRRTQMSSTSRRKPEITDTFKYTRIKACDY